MIYLQYFSVILIYCIFYTYTRHSFLVEITFLSFCSYYIVFLKAVCNCFHYYLLNILLHSLAKALSLSLSLFPPSSSPRADAFPLSYTGIYRKFDGIAILEFQEGVLFLLLSYCLICFLYSKLYLLLCLCSATQTLTW